MFTVAYVGTRRLWPPGPPASVRHRPPTHVCVALFVGGLRLASFLVRLVPPIGTDILNMQVCFIPQYIALFVVGMAAYRGDWPARIPRTFGLQWFRVALSVGPALWVAVLIAGRVWSGDYSLIVGGMYWQSALHCLWESLLCTGMCLGLIVVVREYFNRHTRLTRFLSDNSFAVYVFHAPILIGLTVALHGLAWPPLAKFLLLSVLGLAACLAMSHFVFRRVPGLRRIL